MAHQSNITNSELKSRFEVHEGNRTTLSLHTEMREMFLYVAMKINCKVPDGRAKSVALTELESAAMWTHKAIAELVEVDEIVEEL